MPSLRQELVIRTLLAAIIRVELAGLGLADEAIKVSQALRRHGRTMGTVDAFIAAFCLRHGCALLTRDRDFQAVQTWLGLELIDAARPSA